jgi:Flp pilus assembly protein TadG
MTTRAVAQIVRACLGRRWRDERGGAAVEFALVMPVLVLILFGIIEFARAWNVRQTLTDAVREGARVAVVNNALIPTQTLRDSVETIVMNAASNAGLDLAQLTVTSTGVGGGVTAEVQAEYNYVPLIGLVLNAPITMRTTSVMRNE